MPAKNHNSISELSDSIGIPMYVKKPRDRLTSFQPVNRIRSERYQRYNGMLKQQETRDIQMNFKLNSNDSSDSIHVIESSPPTNMKPQLSHGDYPLRETNRVFSAHNCCCYSFDFTRTLISIAQGLFTNLKRPLRIFCSFISTLGT